MREATGGTAVTAPWGARKQALIRYRSHFTTADTTGPGSQADAQRVGTPSTAEERTVNADTEGIDPDTVLASLLHGHLLRARRVDTQDKAVCLYLARVAALSHLARTAGPR